MRRVFLTLQWMVFLLSAKLAWAQNDEGMMTPSVPWRHTSSVSTIAPRPWQLAQGSLEITAPLANTPANGGAVNPATSNALADILSPMQKLRAQQLTNLFENGSFDFSYDYVENLGDGRGITAGVAGFTSATGDLLEVIKLYTQWAPGNVLERFVPRLTDLDREESESVVGLDGFVDAWRIAATDPILRRAQDQIAESAYYQPSVMHANRLGLSTALARAAIYDTIIQHGNGGDPDSLPSLLERTQSVAGGTPATGVDERRWLSIFLAERRKTLIHAHDENTRDVWQKSVGRCDVFRALAEQGHYALTGRIAINTGGFRGVLPE